MPAYTETELRQTLAKHEGWLRTQPGVVGHGVGLDKGGGLAVKVFVNGLNKSQREAVEAKFAGLPLVIEDHGAIRPQGG